MISAPAIPGVMQGPITSGQKTFITQTSSAAWLLILFLETQNLARFSGRRRGSVGLLDQPHGALDKFGV